MRTTRPIAMGSSGMIASPHYLATLAGLRILQEGGSAVDAAIAVNSTLGVVYPHMTGIGGDAFWLIYDASAERLHALNGSGYAASGASRELYRRSGHAVIPTRGPYSAVTMPGAVDSWCMAHGRFGKLPLARNLAAAISYARNGYPVSSGQVRFTKAAVDMLVQSGAAPTFMPKGRPPVAGEMMSFPALAETMEMVARHGRAGFYEGSVRDEIIRSLAEAGGFWQPDDLAGHGGTWGDPISTDYRGHTCFQHPPNSQGFVHLMIMNILECFDIAAFKADDAAYIHLLVEATKLAFLDRNRYLSDPERCEIPLNDLLSKEYGRELAKRINVHEARPTEPVPMGQDTTCTVVVDGKGNAVSMIQSLYHEFGSGFIAGSTGVLLQNRGSSFSLDPEHVNSLEPGKRCFHTLMPGMLFWNGKPLLVYGTMGGEGQPQTSTAIATRFIDFGEDVQMAIDNPRWLYGRTWGDETQSLRIESRFAEVVGSSLGRRGHDVKVVDAWSDVMGHAAAIKIDQSTGVLFGAADPRGEGIAAGW